MSENTNNLILEHLRALRAGQDAMRADLSEIKQRLGNVEKELGHLHGVVAEQSVSIYRLAGRVERIEIRLELVSP